MKIPKNLFDDLHAAIDAVGGISPDATMRQRWGQLWRSGYAVDKLYGADLHDDNIDTALRRMARSA